MKSRINNPAVVLPDALPAIYALVASAKKDCVPQKTLNLMHLRASQINGCSFCVDMHARELKNADESDQRLFTVSAWRDAPYFTDAERAALALTEAATRLADRPDPVPDEIWDEAARYYDEKALCVLVLNIALINFFNRINVTTRQIAGSFPVNER
ncbi:MAG TPA: carboxymuconolactone decarboxylase family protein [Blastocatellia bacterium]|nr:carboxymuconolactone decarboxylase family protein [Blastocatellia bacterium]